MQIKSISFSMKIYSSIDELSIESQELILQAKNALGKSYSPYSHFKVGAAAQLNDGRIIIGSNQENAAYPATLCAEQVLLANYSCLEKKSAIKTIAVSYLSNNGENNHPVTPCGICRQMLSEYENLQQENIMLLLTGQSGAIWEITGVNSILPLAFNSNSL